MQIVGDNSMSYGLTYVSGLNSSPTTISEKPLLSVHSTVTLTANTLDPGGLRFYSATTTISGPVADYYAITSHDAYHFVQCVPLGGGGCTLTVFSWAASTITVQVLTSATSHISSGGYGLELFNASNQLQFSSNATYPSIITEVSVTPGTGGSTTTYTFTNTTGKTPYFGYGGPRHNGWLKLGNPPTNVSMFFPFAKRVGTTQVSIYMGEVYGPGGGAPGSAMFTNYLPIFVF